MSNPEELEVIAEVNKHWIVLLRPILEFVLFVGIFIFLFLASSLLSEVSLFLGEGLFFFAFLLFGFELHRFFIRLIEWELSAWVITTDYLIDFERSLLTKSDMMLINIRQIDEVEQIKHGFWSNVLNYGDLSLDLPASPIPIVCHRIPHPGKWAQLIKSLQQGREARYLDVDLLKQQFRRRYRGFLPLHRKKLRELWNAFRKRYV